MSTPAAGASVRLDPHQREVLLAMVSDKVSANAVAEQLHSTPGVLYNTLHDARRKLRDGRTPGPEDRHDVEPPQASRRLRLAV